MAGVRHHTHPRFLLKGFASRVEGAKAFAWVYWRDREPQEWSIRDIAVGKHFYGREGDVNADPAITHEEARFAPLVDDLRRAPDGTRIADPMIASLVAHLSIRTKHLRDSVLESADSLLPHIRLYLSDPRNIEALALAGLTRPDAPWSQNRRLRRLAVRQAPSFIRQRRMQLRALAQNALPAVESMLPAAIRSGHIKALASTPVPEPRAEHYRSLCWFVCQSSVPLVIGDVGCLFEVSGPKRYKSLNDKDDQVQRVSLPLLPDRMLVGTPSPTVPRSDFDALVEAHARCSRDFFVCSSPSDRMKALAAKIGDDAALIGKEEMSRLVRALLVEKGMDP